MIGEIKKQLVNGTELVFTVDNPYQGGVIDQNGNLYLVPTNGNKVEKVNLEYWWEEIFKVWRY